MRLASMAFGPPCQNAIDKIFRKAVLQRPSGDWFASCIEAAFCGFAGRQIDIEFFQFEQLRRWIARELISNSRSSPPIDNPNPYQYLLRRNAIHTAQCCIPL